MRKTARLLVEREGIEVREEREVHARLLREGEVRNSGCCVRLLWCTAVFVLFCVCVLICAVLLLAVLSKVTIVVQR